MDFEGQMIAICLLDLRDPNLPEDMKDNLETEIERLRKEKMDKYHSYIDCVLKIK